MKPMRVLCSVCALALSLSVTSAEAWEGDWYPGWWGNYGLGSGWFYHSERVPTPPYFALHPPLYYGPRRALTYGPGQWSQPPQGLDRMDGNPYGTANPAAVMNGPQVQVQVVENPFYVPTPDAKPNSPPPAPAAAGP